MQDGGGCHIEKSKKRDISAAVRAIYTKLFDVFDRSDRYKFEIFKIQDGGGHHVEKSQYLGRGWSDFDEIWHGYAV